MIDVHSHIVFDVDDGPKTLEESLSKAKNKENLESKFNLLKEVLKS